MGMFAWMYGYGVSWKAEDMDIRGGPDGSGYPIPSISTRMEVRLRTKSVGIDDMGR
jgi:hypothetical protein